jgi:hypothetical protein
MADKWVAVLVKADGGVSVRPDNPSESTTAYHAAREGVVFEFRTKLRASDSPYDAIQATLEVLAVAAESAPLEAKR